MQPEEVWPVDDEYLDSYNEMTALGRRTAAPLRANVVSIARNAASRLADTIERVSLLRDGFADLRWYVYENDSADGTDRMLDAAAATRPWMTVEHETLGGIDSRGFERERTERLAYCRNKCHRWVREHSPAAVWTLVLDVDPEFGFSVEGVFNSIAWLGTLATRTPPAGAMASYSLYRNMSGDGPQGFAHYDAWAMRPVSWWRDRRDEGAGMAWASLFCPPVGSRPCPMNSAFGGLCAYTTEAFLAAGQSPYEGGDCEHVFLHRKIAKAGYQLYLNPGCRYIAIWR